MEKLKLSIKIILVIQLLVWIGLTLWAIFGGIELGQRVAQEAADQGAANGSAIGGAIAGAAGGTLTIVFFIAIGIVFGLFAFNTIIAILIYFTRSEHGVFGGIMCFLLASPIAGILIIIEGFKS